MSNQQKGLTEHFLKRMHLGVIFFGFGNKRNCTKSFRISFQKYNAGGFLKIFLNFQFFKAHFLIKIFLQNEKRVPKFTHPKLKNQRRATTRNC